MVGEDRLGQYVQKSLDSVAPSCMISGMPMASTWLVLEHTVQLDMGEEYKTHQYDETKSLHDPSDSVNTLVGVNPDSTNDCLDEVGSKLGGSLYRVAWVHDHAVDKSTFACNSCKVVVG